MGKVNLCGIENETISQNGLRYMSIYQSYFSIVYCHGFHGKSSQLFLCCMLSYLHYFSINRLKRAYSWLNIYKSTVSNCNNCASRVYCFCFHLTEIHVYKTLFYIICTESLLSFTFTFHNLPSQPVFFHIYPYRLYALP